MNTTAPEWATPGKTVAVYTYRNEGDPVALAKVQRTTATQIVLDNGRRFRIGDLQEIAERTRFGPYSELKPVDAPEVKQRLTRQRMRRLARRIGDQIGSMPTDATSEDAVVLLAAIERQVAEARAAIAKLNEKE